METVMCEIDAEYEDETFPEIALNRLKDAGYGVSFMKTKKEKLEGQIEVETSDIFVTQTRITRALSVGYKKLTVRVFTLHDVIMEEK